MTKRPSRRKDTCPHGHAMSPENTYINKRGWRMCRECRRVHSLNRVARMKEGADVSDNVDREIERMGTIPGYLEAIIFHT